MRVLLVRLDGLRISNEIEKTRLSFLYVDNSIA